LVAQDLDLGVELFLLLVGQLQVLGGEAVFAVGQQVVEETGSYGENSGFVASFCGIVNPSESDLMVYVGLNDTHQLASQSAAVVFSQFAKDAATRLNIQPINP